MFTWIMRFEVLFLVVWLLRTNECHLSMDDEWNAFVKTHGKEYRTMEEVGYRRSIWERHMNLASEHNQRHSLGEASFTVGVNKYSDKSYDEYKKTFSNPRQNKSDSINDSNDWFKFNEDMDVPDMVDWRLNGSVTPVKDQGECGSCWAFATTGVLEAQHYLRTGNLVSLSEQNLLDCSSKYENDGCQGGYADEALRYVQENNGIDTEASYPYEGEEYECRYLEQDRGATCGGVIHVPASESSLKVAVAMVGPIAVAVDAARHESFRHYRSGVYDEPQCSHNQTDHVMLLVGYGVYNGLPYWLVKNSWGTSWGMDGYIMMSRNRDNQCGIASYGYFAVV